MTDHLMHLPDDERRAVFLASGDRLGIPAAIVEKDVWICWTLDALFSNPEALPMAFKGGTSLSKVFGAIDRFSEDVDLTIGFDEIDDELPTSRKKRDELGDRLRYRVTDHLEGCVVPLLAGCLRREFDAGNVTMTDGETVVVDYPSCFEKHGGYIFERVKVEFGGRNTIEPHARHTLRPYVADLGYDVDTPTADVDVLSPLRTFWEKATLAHAECGLDRWKHDGGRFARHWYDLNALADHDIGRRAIVARHLLADVVRIKNAFWYRATANYDACLAGGLRLLPAAGLLAYLRRDYDDMIEAGMFSVAPPPFDSIVERLVLLEAEINEAAGGRR